MTNVRVKTLLLALALLAPLTATRAQSTSGGDLAQRVQRLEDRAALKALVDTFSILADRKDVAKQVLLFTEDATVDSYSNGRPGGSFKGRQQIGAAFAGFLANFETVYHVNGQQAVDIQGDRATGTAYCLVVLIGRENGKPKKTTMGVAYDDEYVRRGGAWLIAKRVSHFTWQTHEELPQPPAR
jgi:ketosteroid isomerase-like protein